MPASKSTFRFSGWQGVIALIAVLGIVGVRLMTLDSNMGDTELMQKLEFQIMTDYFPDDVKQLRPIYESGDREAIAKAVKSITSSKITIKSVYTSAPLLTFSSNQKVVVKVSYSLDDAAGHRDEGTKYYRFRHGGLMGSRWSSPSEVGAIRYYLNFL